MARLHTETRFLDEISQKFETGYKLKFHLAPPLLSPRNPDTGEARKIELNEWILPLLRAVARLKFLRGTPFDIFGYTEERRRERRLSKEYEAMISSVLQELTPKNHDIAVEIASIPELIRGYGHIKSRSIDIARQREAILLAELANPKVKTTAAAE